MYYFSHITQSRSKCNLHQFNRSKMPAFVSHSILSKYNGFIPHACYFLFTDNCFCSKKNTFIWKTRWQRKEYNAIYSCPIYKTTTTAKENTFYKTKLSLKKKKIYACFNDQTWVTQPLHLWILNGKWPSSSQWSSVFNASWFHYLFF